MTTLANMVKQTSTSTGATTLVLTGAAQRPYQNFSDALENGDTTEAMVVSRATGAWQAAVYTYNSGVLTFSRFLSSSTGSVISFTAGLKDVYIPPLAERAVTSVDNVEALLALRVRPDTVFLAGSLAAGDGGFGVNVHWFPGDTTTADNYTIFSPTSGEAGRYKIVWDGAASAAWYGHFGTGDKSAAMQAAIDAAAARYSAGGNGAIIVPAIDCRWDSEITLQEGVRLLADPGVNIDVQNGGKLTAEGVGLDAGVDLVGTLDAGAMSIPTATSHGMVEGDHALIWSQRDASNVEDCGVYWCGYTTDGTLVPYLAEVKAVADAPSATTLTLGEPLEFGGYSDTDAAETSYQGTRAKTTVHKISFLRDIEIRGFNFLNCPQIIVISLKWCLRPRIIGPTFDFNTDGGRTGRGQSIVTENCLEEYVEGPETFRPADMITEPRHNEFNSYKHVSGWNANWVRPIDHNGAQGLDTTFRSAAWPVMHMSVFEPTSYGNKLNAITSHGLVWGWKVVNLKSYGCLEGIITRARHTEIVNPEIVGGSWADDTWVGIRFFVSSRGARVRGGRIEGYYSGIDTYRSEVGNFGVPDRDIEISGVRFENCYRSAYLHSGTGKYSNKVSAASVTAGGSGGTNGTQTVTATTGSGLRDARFTVTVTGGAIASVDAILDPGSYTTDPTTPAAVPVTGAGLVGATLNLTLIEEYHYETAESSGIRFIDCSHLSCRDGIVGLNYVNGVLVERNRFGAMVGPSPIGVDIADNAILWTVLDNEFDNIGALAIGVGLGTITDTTTFPAATYTDQNNFIRGNRFSGAFLARYDATYVVPVNRVVGRSGRVLDHGGAYDVASTAIFENNGSNRIHLLGGATGTLGFYFDKPGTTHQADFTYQMSDDNFVMRVATVSHSQWGATYYRPTTDAVISLGNSTRRFNVGFFSGLVQANLLDITDGVSAPGVKAGFARIYVDTADGDLKVIFGDGTIKTIMTDT